MNGINRNIHGEGLMKTNICLIGFMLTGKTTIGRALATKLGKDFIEMDAEIESLSGQTIPKLFLKGEKHFRDWEEKACKTIAKRRNTVISCGGGIILRKTNIKALRQTSIMILLKSSPEIIHKRFLDSDPSARPLLGREDPLGEIHRLLHKRDALYDNSSEIYINADNPITTVVDDIINRLQMVK